MKKNSRRRWDASRALRHLSILSYGLAVLIVVSKWKKMKWKKRNSCIVVETRLEPLPYSVTFLYCTAAPVISRLVPNRACTLVQGTFRLVVAWWRGGKRERSCVFVWKSRSRLCQIYNVLDPNKKMRCQTKEWGADYCVNFTSMI